MPGILHDGRNVNYEEAGAGPVLVLLPPGASRATIWRGVSERLADRFHTIAIDMTGFGGTDAWNHDRPLTLDDEVAAIAAVVASVSEASVIGSAGAPLHLAGHSYGGAVAFRLAVMRILPLASLTLIEPAPYPILAEAGEEALFEEAAAINLGFIEAVEAGKSGAAFERYLDYYTDGPDTWAAFNANARARLLQSAPNVARALTAVHADNTSHADAGALELPARLIHGALTSRPHARLCEILAAIIPGAALSVVEDAGHMLTITHPDAVATLIAELAGKG
ncbi:MAG: alpha/beta fold hydrolase [Alphaproteobacteria bacterium]